MNLDEVVKNAMAQGAMVERPVENRSRMLGRSDIPVNIAGRARARRLVHLQVDCDLPDALTAFEHVHAVPGKELVVMAKAPDGEQVEILVPWERVKVLVTGDMPVLVAQ